MRVATDVIATDDGPGRGDDVLNLAQRVDRLPNTRYQALLLMVIGTAWFLDVLDVSSMTYVLAPISRALSLTAHQSGLLVSAGFIGMAIGGTGAGMLADRFGRKIVFQYSMVVSGVASLLLAISWSFESMLAFRFLLGLGMGAEYPVAAALLAEITPTRNRGRVVAWVSQIAGASAFIAAGLLSFFLISWIGWRGFFAVEGFLAAFVLVVRRIVPESPRWFENRGRFAEAEQVMREIERRTEQAYGRPLAEPGAPKYDERATAKARFGILELFSRRYIGRTLMAWTLWLCFAGGYYGLQSWIGKLLADSGISIAQSIKLVLLMVLWAIPGGITSGWLCDKLGRKATLCSFMMASAAAAYVYGQATSQNELLVSGSVMQFFFFGVWAALYAYTGDVFPTLARSTGAGSAATFGRLGSIVSPLVIPVVMASYGTPGVFLLTGVIPFLIAVLAVLLLGPETKGRVLEEVSR